MPLLQDEIWAVPGGWHNQDVTATASSLLCTLCIQVQSAQRPTFTRSTELRNCSPNAHACALAQDESRVQAAVPVGPIAPRAQWTRCHHCAQTRPRGGQSSCVPLAVQTWTSRGLEAGPPCCPADTPTTLGGSGRWAGNGLVGQDPLVSCGSCIRAQGSGRIVSYCCGGCNRTTDLAVGATQVYSSQFWGQTSSTGRAGLESRGRRAVSLLVDPGQDPFPGCGTTEVPFLCWPLAEGCPILTPGGPSSTSASLGPVSLNCSSISLLKHKS